MPFCRFWILPFFLDFCSYVLKAIYSLGKNRRSSGAMSVKQIYNVNG